MTFREQLESDVSEVFLNTDDFAGEIGHYRNGTLLATVSGVLEEQSSNLTREQHLQEQRTSRLHLPDSIAPEVGDWFDIAGERWSFQSIYQNTHGMLIVDVAKHIGKRSGTR